VEPRAQRIKGIRRRDRRLAPLAVLPARIQGPCAGNARTWRRPRAPRRRKAGASARTAAASGRAWSSRRCATRRALLGYSKIVRDLTERRAEEERARHAEERFRLLIEGVTEYAIFLSTPDGTIASWNPGAQRIKGYTATRVIGRHFSIFYPAEALARTGRRASSRKRARLGRFEDEGWRIRKDGSRFWANVVITAMRNPDGTLRGFSKITRDLTERKRHEEQLRRSEERFRLLIEGVQDYAILMLDPSGPREQLELGRAAHPRLYGREVIGQSADRFFTARRSPRGRPGRIASQRAHYRHAQDIGWRVRKDGGRFWADVNTTALHDATASTSVSRR
jgi:PAS domain S-box-containing protein